MLPPPASNCPAELQRQGRGIPFTLCGLLRRLLCPLSLLAALLLSPLPLRSPTLLLSTDLLLSPFPLTLFLLSPLLVSSCLLAGIWWRGPWL
jgi:hypothetical protein